MRRPKYLQNVLIGATAVLVAGSHFVPGHEQSGPVVTAATEFVIGKPAAPAESKVATSEVAGAANAAPVACSSSVHKPSRPEALEDAFRSYFAYKTSHPNEIKKPYLYFVDYG